MALSSHKAVHHQDVLFTPLAFSYRRGRLTAFGPEMRSTSVTNTDYIAVRGHWMSSGVGELQSNPETQVLRMTRHWRKASCY